MSSTPEIDRIAGTSLSLLRIPFALSQEKLLRSKDLIDSAKEWGIQTDLDELEKLHRIGAFVPLFRVDDDVDASVAVPNPTGDYSDVVEWARQGKLRDPSAQPYDEKYPHRWTESLGDHWWNGYLYSRWQLLSFDGIRSLNSWVPMGASAHEVVEEGRRRRLQALTLLALSSRHLPPILGQLKLVGSSDRESLVKSRYELTEASRLEAVGAAGATLAKDAEHLLLKAAHDDPMSDWWPVIRHARHRGWSKMSGAPAFAVWRRVAAEILLRAHEHMAEEGLLPALPVPPAGSRFRHPLQDRVSVVNELEDGLDRSLGILGVSPYPRVLLVLEGETEMVQVPWLLAAAEIDRSNQVRVLNAHSSGSKLQHVARYAATPRVGPARWGRQFFDATPTALFVAMDAENLWATAEKRAGELKTLRDAVRIEVEAQGGKITDRELEMLVHLHVWGKHSYEFANFSDADLLKALAQLALEQGVERVDVAWRSEARKYVRESRVGHKDIKDVFPKLGLRVTKPRLAEILLPALSARFEREWYSSRPPRTPVIRMLAKVNRLVQRLDGGSFSFETDPV